MALGALPFKGLFYSMTSCSLPITTQKKKTRVESSGPPGELEPNLQGRRAGSGSGTHGSVEATRARMLFHSSMLWMQMVPPPRFLPTHRSVISNSRVLNTASATTAGVAIPFQKLLSLTKASSFWVGSGNFLSFPLNGKRTRSRCGCGRCNVLRVAPEFTVEQVVVKLVRVPCKPQAVR